MSSLLYLRERKREDCVSCRCNMEALLDAKADFSTVKGVA